MLNSEPKNHITKNMDETDGINWCSNHQPYNNNDNTFLLCFSYIKFQAFETTDTSWKGVIILSNQNLNIKWHFKKKH